MKRVLFITNGHGEDLVAAGLVKELAKDAVLLVLPLVGEGKAFNGLPAELIGPRRTLPGGGFSLRNLVYLGRDIFSGLIGHTREQLAVLRELRGQVDLTIAVGDLVPIIGALVVRAPFIFVGVNKSAYYRRFGSHYTPWEKLLLSRYALKAYVRDKVTEHDLQTRGIKVLQAQYVGNPLMDAFDPARDRTERDPETRVIGLLPGTRADARLNLEDFHQVIHEIIKLKNSHFGLRFLVATELPGAPEYMEKVPFGRLLAGSDLILGLSGTGNEQAAGSGLPVVSFYGRGSQYNRAFAEAQQELLGEALDLVRDSDPISVASEVWELLRHPEKMARMGKVGRERMGEPGAVPLIAAKVGEMLR